MSRHLFRGVAVWVGNVGSLRHDCRSPAIVIARLILTCDTALKLSGKHRSTLEAIFADPVRSSIVWTEIEALLRACGAEVSEGQGSRVRVALNGVRAVFHRPHPQKETDKGAVKSVRRFLVEAGIEP